jgi:membrane associated rhomboid family serine protease
MSKNGKINLFSKTFLFIAGSIYIINYLLKGLISDSLHFDPTLVTYGNYEYWRFLSYPFATGTIEGVLLFALTFYIISPKIENILKKLHFPLLILLLILFHSVINTFLFLNNDININIYGMEGVSIFVLTLYVFLRPKEKVGILNFPIISTALLSFLIIMTWAGLKYYNIVVNNEPLTYSAVSTFIIGVGSALVLFAQIKLLQIFTKKKMIKKQDDPKIPQEKEEEKYSYAMMSQSNVKKYNQDQESYDEEHDELILSNDPEENEQILNDILEKISEHGKESITPPEIKFLREYSKHID